MVFYLHSVLYSLVGPSTRIWFTIHDWGTQESPITCIQSCIRWCIYLHLVHVTTHVWRTQGVFSRVQLGGTSCTDRHVVAKSASLQSENKTKSQKFTQAVRSDAHKSQITIPHEIMNQNCTHNKIRATRINNQMHTNQESDLQTSNQSMPTSKRG